MRYWMGPSRDPSEVAAVVLVAAESPTVDRFLLLDILLRRRLPRGRRDDKKLSGEDEAVEEDGCTNSPFSSA
jgi:hypothetical protein